jgi:hypothetical protein
MIEGFKASDSIQVFIPGCRPLSEGVISDWTRRFVDHVCDRQCVHISYDSIGCADYAPKNIADLTT